MLTKSHPLFLSLEQKIVVRKFCNMMINFGHSRSKFVFIGSVSRNMFSFSPCPRICSEIIGIFGGVGGLSLGERQKNRALPPLPPETQAEVRLCLKCRGKMQCSCCRLLITGRVTNQHPGRNFLVLNNTTLDTQWRQNHQCSRGKKTAFMGQNQLEKLETV